VYSIRLLAALVSGLCVGILATPAIAQSARARATANVDLAARLKEVEHDPKLTTALLKTGRQVASVCDNCHGESGNSPKPDVPNLAGQSPAYLLEQLRQYANGQRPDFFMEGMIKVMTSDEKVGMAIFYAKQGVVYKPTANFALAARGQALYNKACTRCHDEDGLGDEKIARIAGQQPEYLRLALKRYRTATGSRLDERMVINVKQMTQADIEAVVAFVVSMGVTSTE
jgi:cytochrome c553